MKQFGTPRNSLVSPLPFSMDAKNVRFLAVSLMILNGWSLGFFNSPEGNRDNIIFR